MILNDNLLILRNKFPALLERVKNMEEQGELQFVSVVQAKSNVSNLAVERDGQQYFVHSKYDPVNEANKFIEQFELLPSHHVFFYGLGLGYHIRAMQDKLGETPFTIYEPDPAIFYKFLCTHSLREFAFKNLRNIYIGSEKGQMAENLARFVGQVKNPVLFVSWPAYRVIMKSETERFEELFRETVKDQRNKMYTNKGYEKLWTVNSGNNFKTVLESPSVLRQKKSYFEGKPAIIVSAGPSLDEEIENIRYIKEGGLAYIIAVGSANRALIHQNIHPDAVAAYDPNPRNYRVFGEIIEQDIRSIPLIFGTSGSYITVDKYPGPKLHMITSQDPISSFLFGSAELISGGEVIHDAPSIAVLTLELLFKLNCSQIILVGQNFGFRKDKFYAGQISYSDRPAELTDTDKANLTEIESVDGSMMLSNYNNIISKRQMEYVLSRVPRNIEVINTTVGGAKLEGTTFIHLKDVIESRLHERVVHPDWYNASDNFGYDFEYIKKQGSVLKQQYEQFVETANELLRVMRRLDVYARNNELQQINQTLPKFDKLFKRLIKNKYMTVIILPLIRVQYDIFQKSIPDVRFEADPAEKAKRIITVFGKFIAESKTAHEQIGNLLYAQVNQNILRLTQRLESM